MKMFVLVAASQLTACPGTQKLTEARREPKLRRTPYCLDAPPKAVKFPEDENGTVKLPTIVPTVTSPVTR